jgi:metal-responsive CopG/Arc/MetJ family transcriptional regulator
VGTNKFPFMPNVSLTITLPEDVAQQVHETARSQYLSRSAVLRQIIMKELERLRGAESQASAEVPA